MGINFQEAFIKIAGVNKFDELNKRYDGSMKTMIAEARAEGLGKKKAE